MAARRLDASPFPVAIRRVEVEKDGPQFPTYLINNAYVSRFGVTKRRFADRTPDEILNAKSAAVFYEGNKHVFDNRMWRLQDECFDDPATGKSACAPVLRYYTTLPDGSPAIKVIIFDGMDLGQ